MTQLILGNINVAEDHYGFSVSSHWKVPEFILRADDTMTDVSFDNSVPWLLNAIVGKPLVVALAGLPGRGKTIISTKLKRLLTWNKIVCEVGQSAASILKHHADLVETFWYILCLADTQWLLAEKPSYSDDDDSFMNEKQWRKK